MVLFVLGGFACAQSAYTPLTSSVYVSLSAQGRWHHYWKDTLLSPYLYLGSAAGAGIATLRNDPPEWRDEGYTKRYASYVGTILVKNTISQGTAAVLEYDPRYQHCDCRGIWPRTSHALIWTFLTKNANGATRFNLPMLTGAYGAGMLSTYWYPSRYNPLTDGVRFGSRQVGVNVGVDILREFSPEIRRFVHFYH